MPVNPPAPEPTRVQETREAIARNSIPVVLLILFSVVALIGIIGAYDPLQVISGFVMGIGCGLVASELR